MTMSASARRSASSARSRGDAVEQPAVALQRVRAADRLEPAHERLVGGVEEDQAAGASPRSRSAVEGRRGGRSKKPRLRTSTTAASRG